MRVLLAGIGVAAALFGLLRSEDGRRASAASLPNRPAEVGGGVSAGELRFRPSLPEQLGVQAARWTEPAAVPVVGLIELEITHAITGEPLAGVDLLLGAPDQGAEIIARSDERGVIALDWAEAPPSHAWLRCLGFGLHRIDSSEWKAGEPTTVRLAPLAQLRVRVVEDQDRTVDLMFQHADGRQAEHDLPRSHDADWTHAWLEPGQVIVIAHTPEGAIAEQRMWLEPGEIRDLVLYPGSPRSVRVKVVDRFGRPVPDVDLEFAPLVPGPLGEGPLVALGGTRTGDDGTAHVPASTSTPMRVVASVGGDELGSRVVAGDDVTVTLDRDIVRCSLISAGGAIIRHHQYHVTYSYPGGGGMGMGLTSSDGDEFMRFVWPERDTTRVEVELSTGERSGSIVLETANDDCRILARPES